MLAAWRSTSGSVVRCNIAARAHRDLAVTFDSHRFRFRLVLVGWLCAVVTLFTTDEARAVLGSRDLNRDWATDEARVGEVLICLKPQPVDVWEFDRLIGELAWHALSGLLSTSGSSEAPSNRIDRLFLPVSMRTDL